MPLPHHDPPTQFFLWYLCLFLCSRDDAATFQIFQIMAKALTNIGENIGETRNGETGTSDILIDHAFTNVHTVWGDKFCPVNKFICWNPRLKPMRKKPVLNLKWENKRSIRLSRRCQNVAQNVKLIKLDMYENAVCEQKNVESSWKHKWR